MCHDNSRCVRHLSMCSRTSCCVGLSLLMCHGTSVHVMSLFYTSRHLLFCHGTFHCVMAPTCVSCHLIHMCHRTLICVTLSHVTYLGALRGLYVVREFVRGHRNACSINTFVFELDLCDISRCLSSVYSGFVRS